jgi:hypothetical protein
MWHFSHARNHVFSHSLPPLSLRKSFASYTTSLFIFHGNSEFISPKLTTLTFHSSVHFTQTFINADRYFCCCYVMNRNWLCMSLWSWRLTLFTKVDPWVFTLGSFSVFQIKTDKLFFKFPASLTTLTAAVEDEKWRCINCYEKKKSFNLVATRWDVPKI